MSYDGAVQPGGPAQVREVGTATVRKLAVSQMSNNVYLITCAATGVQALIDAADDARRLIALVAEGTGELESVITTHQHWDHVRALPELLNDTGARSFAGAEDADALPVPPDVRLHDGDTVSVGDLVLDVTHVRGHTPGGICLSFTDPDGLTHLFTGDSLFPGGIGATDRYEYQSFPQLIDDVSDRIFGRFGDRTWVYPGHGDDTTLATERPHLEQWRERGW
ncbi:MBL fold metallo-hydrolase [Dermacoccaceae bacterium W4C1]